jgi:hypothetical protein
MMNFTKIASFHAAFFISLTLISCTTVKEIPNNLTAKEILKRTVAASGGDTWQQPSTLLLRGVATFTPHGKTDSLLQFDRYAMYRIFPTENNAAHQANGKVRFDAFYGQNSFFELKFDGKKSKMALSDRAKPYAKQFNWSNNFGFGIIRFADRDSFQVTRLTDDQVEGFPCYIVQITDPKKMSTTFGIDKKSYFIRTVAFNTDVGYHHRVYSEFKRAKNCAFIQPTRVRLYFDGVKWMDIDWQTFQVNEAIDENVFN